MPVTNTERTRQHRRRLWESGAKRVDVILSKEAVAALSFLMVEDGASERDVIDGAIRAMAKLRGYGSD